MRHSFLRAAATALLLTVGAAAFAGIDTYGARAALATSSTSPTVIQMLTWAMEDEYLARAEYAAVMERYGETRPFSNIVRAEEQHVQWLLELFDDYGHVVPEDSAPSLVQAPGSMKEALEHGVQAEIDNIAMYELFLEQALPDDVRDTFERLMRASENHLRAFRTNLARYN
jgi:hypothetical protein